MMGQQGEMPGAELNSVCIESRTDRALKVRSPGQPHKKLDGEFELDPRPEPKLACHYCPECTALAFPKDVACLYCDGRRPEAGWPALIDAADPWLGRVIGARYLITRRIARSAAARVYEAESLRIQRQFALKLVDFGPDSPVSNPGVVRARLRREIQAMSQLRAPHIIGIIEVIRLSQTCLAVVMDYIDAPTLSRVLADVGAMGWRRACRLVRQVARAAHAAHRAGLVHRDLKPANIMVEPVAGGADYIHLLDFGIVSVNDGRTITRGFVGTPLYASPEQARGASIDRRSDIYSLGVVLFEMLVGHPPFESSKVREVLHMQVKRPAPALQKSAPGRRFPARLCGLVKQMLKKDRCDRPQDLLAVIASLDAILAAPTDNTRARRCLPTCLHPSGPAPCTVRPACDASSTGGTWIGPLTPSSTQIGHGILEIYTSHDAPFCPRGC